MCFASCGTVSEFDTASQTVSAFSAMSDDTATTAQYYETAQTTQSSVDDIQSGEYKITITAGETTLNAVWEKNATTDYFVEQMPFTVPMMDLYGREMCYRYGAYALPTDDLRSDGYEVGDIAYWPPGGSLVILYKQNGEEFERQHLGHIDSGVELFETTGDIDVTFALEEPTEYSYTIQDVRNLQNFILDKPTEEDLTGKPYDLNGDGRWDIFDICLMRREVLNNTNTASDHDTLVIYFSRTGNTEKIAEYLIELTDADSYVIEAAVPYTDDDIKYQDDNCRANKEQNDKSVRPEIANPIASIDSYDTIFLGYPIWWGQEPRIIDTFLESYDFSDKTVIPFCTSGSSGIGTSEKNISELVTIETQLEGKRFPAGASKDEVKEWYDTLNLNK
jgi:flavodoxin